MRLACFFIVGWWVLVIYCFVTFIFLCYYYMCQSVFKSFIQFFYDQFQSAILIFQLCSSQFINYLIKTKCTLWFLQFFISILFIQITILYFDTLVPLYSPQPMIQFIYVIFFWLIVLQVGIFAFLNIPSPFSWRATLIRFINTNYYIKVILRYHLWLCLISGFFFYDSWGTQKSILNEIINIKQHSNGNIASELRKGYLSYTFLKIQRNEYITLMLIYVSITLHIQLALLHYIYVKRGKYHNEGIEETAFKKEIDPMPSKLLFETK